MTAAEKPEVTTGSLFGVPLGTAKNTVTTRDTSDELVGGIEQRAEHYDRLLDLCRSLRAGYRCPGRCVFTGELRRDGLTAMRSRLESHS